LQRKHLISAVSSIFFLACPLLAQEEPASIATFEFQKPKNGMVQQYEAGRKQKAAWHKQQNDPLPLYVWEILSGDNTGTYVVGRMGQHWADFDKPAVSDEADRGEYQKVIGTYVDSLTTSYYRLLNKISNPGDMKTPTKFVEVLVFHVRYGRTGDFRSAISQVYTAGQKTKWPVNYEWYELVNGGTSGEYVLALPRKSWADFEDKPDVKPFRDMLKEAFGQAEADSIVNRIDSSVERLTTDISQFRPDLSYLPAQ
jgi:hypothetical protein